MVQIAIWWYSMRMVRTLTAINDRIEAHDHALFCCDMEACDEVEKQIRQLRRKTIRYAAAIQRLKQRKHQIKCRTSKSP